MKLLTTIVDDMDLQIAPDNFSADPVSRSAIGQGVLGAVHFMWPASERVELRTLYYDKITIEQARRLVSALGPPTIHNKVLQFEVDGPMYSIPGKVGIDVRVEAGYCNIMIQTATQEILGMSS